MPDAGQLPNLIITGAMKCGTTSLHYYLNQHPQIFMTWNKELDFFSGLHLLILSPSAPNAGAAAARPA
jgi:hypothetical protein